MFNTTEHPHTRLNILTGEFILVSPHRMKRPWQGKVEAASNTSLPAYDPTCYLCPGNKRSEGAINPVYTNPFVFTNDFSALLSDTPTGGTNEQDLLVSKSEAGMCRVICFSPNHSLTLPLMDVADIEKVIQLWKEEFTALAAHTNIRYIQIFENKGDIMGCSNPHPHGQIWASTSVPVELQKETTQQQQYFEKHGRSLLSDYLTLELQKQERIVVENEHFVALVPYWAVWPYETMIISKRHVQQVTQFTAEEDTALADVLKRLTTRYDNLFSTSFPYSAGMHQMPVNESPKPGWHWHMHFYPPLLRSATVKKFMVGYEMLATPQRDITAEMAADKLRSLSEVHYKHSAAQQ
ncbi:MAG: UDP-glucose--hexose-1-phosphate uridylyltransferase [Bacteroidetes bacterium]|uniref:UDP-glucose--hexose-1-phosphate uridylyltransferase n=1 Tax=Phnomibacter sp. TaxID=2836217 RepID=UPI002FDD626B|nr:UDP-glucose--hexose-1-phosphate uridylyltransferase [Bacteroidota bacterium]